MLWVLLFIVVVVLFLMGVFVIWVGARRMLWERRGPKVGDVWLWEMPNTGVMRVQIEEERWHPDRGRMIKLGISDATVWESESEFKSRIARGHMSLSIGK